MYEAPSEKAALVAGMTFLDKEALETLIVIPLEEAKELLKR